MNVGQAVSDLARQFQMAGIDTARLDARILVAHVVGVTVEKIFGYPETELSDSQYNDLQNVTLRRANREPLSRIVGTKEFWSLPFKVSPETLIPRPDSECVVEAILDHIGDSADCFNILDLGTGTGCLIICLLHELSNARGMGVDISHGALTTAAENAYCLKVSSRVTFEHNNWCEGLELEHSSNFDIIVSNPPYIPDDQISALEPEVATHEPLRALAGGPDGLDIYRLLVVATKKLIKPGGILAFEIGATQLDAVIKLGKTGGFELVEVQKDIAGIDRCIVFKNP